MFYQTYRDIDYIQLLYVSAVYERPLVEFQKPKFADTNIHGFLLSEYTYTPDWVIHRSWILDDGFFVMFSFMRDEF